MPDADAENLRNILASHIGDYDTPAVRQRIQEEIDNYLRRHPSATRPIEIVQPSDFTDVRGISTPTSDIDVSSFYPNSILLDSVVDSITASRRDATWGTISHPSAFSPRWRTEEPFDVEEVLEKYKYIRDRFALTREEIPEHCISSKFLLENWLRSMVTKEINQASHGFGFEAILDGAKFSMPNGMTARLNTMTYRNNIEVKIEAYPFMYTDNYDFDKILNPVAMLVGTVEEFKKVYNKHGNL